MEAEFVTPLEILKGLSKGVIQDVYLRSHLDEPNVEKLKKPQMVATMNKDIENTGIKALIENLKRDDLKTTTTDLSLTFKEEDNKSNTPRISISTKPIISSYPRSEIDKGRNT